MLERIKELCKEKGITVQQLEIKAGFSNGAIRKWAKSVPKADSLLIVANILEVSTEYLLTGEERPAQMDEPSPGERAVIERLRKMPNTAQAQAAVLAFLQALEQTASASDE